MFFSFINHGIHPWNTTPLDVLFIHTSLHTSLEYDAPGCSFHSYIIIAYILDVLFIHKSWHTSLIRPPGCSFHSYIIAYILGIRRPWMFFSFIHHGIHPWNTTPLDVLFIHTSWYTSLEYDAPGCSFHSYIIAYILGIRRPWMFFSFIHHGIHPWNTTPLDVLFIHTSWYTSLEYDAPGCSFSFIHHCIHPWNTTPLDVLFIHTSLHTLPYITVSPLVFFLFIHPDLHHDWNTMPMGVPFLHSSLWPTSPECEVQRHSFHSYFIYIPEIYACIRTVSIGYKII
ncbi:hypothetical protein CEXT_127731 [Caerostris extrusa]|uniref:Cytochrome c oxidase subunit 1 n=1 Tax=Caerostris extrusa TaxID=172846 RepID=A0AAV4S7M9_CAEEX|nr:hypothetical protein CEXT_127731 [Caerostris extrusa]